MTGARWPLTVALVTLVACSPACRAESTGEDNAASAEFFETRVRPVLVARCHECHGPDSDGEGNLRVDSLAALLKGGDLGPAVKPGDAAGSLLVRAVRHGDVVEMPPKTKLPPREIADLTAWISAGAKWPNTIAPTQPATTADDEPRPLTDDDRNYWAFQTPVEPVMPAVKDTTWPRGTLDHFVLAGLEAHGLAPAAPADKRTLLRRVTFDLTGLPPSMAEIDAFLADERPDALASVVDRLLASPRHGERWGRRWLDIARYADSNGMDENMAMAHAWRYRDWVVAAFNRDLPYDEFIRDQIAGDLAPPSADAQTNADRLIATAFLVLGPKMLAEDDPVKMEMDIIDEQVDTIGRAFLGLSLGCARCHDHKFDPISMADYYSLAGIFKSTKTMENYRVVAMWSERPLGTPDELQLLAAADRQVAAMQKEVSSLEAQIPKLIEPRAGAGLGDHLLSLLSRQRKQRELAQKQDQLKQAQAARPTLPVTLAVSERDAQNLRIHRRGSHLTLGREVPRQFPRILTRDNQQPLGSDTSGRLELADWLTQVDHPLTSRVMVNRIWQGHFGEGLVRSVDNFGRLGRGVDNQRLLDWLALRFVESGWSIKAMHRLIVLSSAYQMSTAHNPQAAAADPENRLLWRMNRRRLEAEEIRDALLAASGRLDLAMGGPSMKYANHTYVTSTASSNDVNYQSYRRTVYLPVVRSSVYDVLSAFDFADPSTGSGKRPSTTVAPQALFMMNSSLMLAESRAMAESLLGVECEDSARIDNAYRRTLCRPATSAEIERALRFLADYQADLASDSVDAQESKVRAWQALCRTILASNEFVYVD
jgi:mono/diheme cytochrome c family protein